ncbi:MAG: MFS transporter [Pseudomonadota bacterium]
MSRTPFTLYLIAQASATLASSMLPVAVGWHLYERTGDAFDLALVGLVQIVPICGLFLVSGWVIDNVQRKLVLVACSALQGLLLVALTSALGVDQFTRTAVFTLLFLNGVARAFLMPAGQSVLPGIVKQDYLPRAVAISSTVWTASGAAGPFAAGLLIAWLDVGVYQLLSVLAFLSGAMYLFLPSLEVRRTAGRGLTQLLSGIRYIAKSPLLLPAISLDLVIVLVGSVVVLLPVFAVEILNVGPEALGTMRAMPAVGAVVAGILLARLPPMRSAGRLLFFALGVFAISILVFAVSHSLWLSLVALFIYGASDMVSVNIRMTVVHSSTPDELRGRVNSVNSLFISTSNDMGDFRAGAVAAVIGPAAATLIGGLMAAIVAIGGYALFPRLRRLDKLTDATVDQAISTVKQR